MTSSESFELTTSIKYLEQTLKMKMLQAAEQMDGGYSNLSGKTVNEIQAIQTAIDDKTKRLASLTLGFVQGDSQRE